MADTSPASIKRIVEQIRSVLFPMLAGQPPEVQGAVLADLVAIWLAGHVCVGAPETTAKMREALLMLHVEAVRKLILVNAKMMGTDG